MGAWLSNISLKYKFWAVNAVAFVTTLFVVLYAVHLETRANGLRLRLLQKARPPLLLIARNLRRKALNVIVMMPLLRQTELKRQRPA